MSTFRCNQRSQTLIAKVLGFAQVSGAGLALDVGLFLLLVSAGWPPGYANLVSATTAVTFVYFVSTKRVFEYQGRFLMPLFLAYLAYQALAVAGASWAVDRIAGLGIMPVVAKGSILPFTFSANYLFLDFLTRFGR
jgi:putative flippase GtrA